MRQRFAMIKNQDIRGNHMRNLIAMLFLSLLMSGTAVAKDITLYEISSRTLDIADAIAVCADPEGACADEDIKALKEDIANNRRELMGSIKSGTLPGLMLTLEEGETLQARTKDLQSRFAHIALFDGICNKGTALATTALWFMQYALYNWLPLMKEIFNFHYPFLFNLVAAALVTVLGAFALLVDIAMGILALPALSACLFWWL